MFKKIQFSLALLSSAAIILSLVFIITANKTYADTCDECINSTKANCPIPLTVAGCFDYAQQQCQKKNLCPTTKADSSADQGGIDLTIQDVEAGIMSLTCWIMRVSVAVMVLFILYTGFLFMSAQGVPANVQKAQASLKYVLLGIAVIVGVYTIIGTVALAVGRNDFSFATCSGRK